MPAAWTSATRSPSIPSDYLLRVGLLRLGRRTRRATCVRVDDTRDGLRRRVGDVEKLDVLGRDQPFRQCSLAQPAEQALPVAAVEEHDRKVEHLAGLDQRQRLE